MSCHDVTKSHWSIINKQAVLKWEWKQPLSIIGLSCIKGCSCIHCFVKRVERLRIFIHRDRIELLNCFVWNYREPRNMYLDGYKFVVVWFSFVYMFSWTWSDTDLEQMLRKKCQNICQNGHWMLETSCEEGLQPEGAHFHHSETVIN